MYTYLKTKLTPLYHAARGTEPASGRGRIPIDLRSPTAPLVKTIRRTDGAISKIDVGDQLPIIGRGATVNAFLFHAAKIFLASKRGDLLSSTALVGLVAAPGTGKFAVY